MPTAPAFATDGISQLPMMPIAAMYGSIVAASVSDAPRPKATMLGTLLVALAARVGNCPGSGFLGLGAKMPKIARAAPSINVIHGKTSVCVTRSATEPSPANPRSSPSPRRK